MAFIHKVIPGVIRAKASVTDLLIKGTEFVLSPVRTIRFLSPDHTVVVTAAEFTVHSDTSISIGTITFDVVGTYRIQLEGPGGVLATMDGALVVNLPPISFTLNPSTVYVNAVTDDIELRLVGVASAQVEMVQFTGVSLFEVTDFERPDPKTIKFFPLSPAFLGDYDIQLFSDNEGTEPLGDPQVAGLHVVEEPAAPDIDGVDPSILQPGETGRLLKVTGSGFSLDAIDVIRLESQAESFAFTPQAPPFVPEEDIPAGKFRLQSNKEIVLADFTPTVPGDFGVVMQKLNGATLEYVTSRTKALSVKDTRKPGIVFSPLPGNYEDPVSVTLRAEFTDVETGLPNGEEDTTAQLYVVVIPIDQTQYQANSFVGGAFGDMTDAPGFGQPIKPFPGPSMAYTGPIEISGPSVIKAIAVDAADNYSDVYEGFFDIRNHADRISLGFEPLAETYARFANVNRVIKELRIKYKGILNEDTVPGVTQTAPGNSAAKASLLRDMRQGVVDLLHNVGKALYEVLVPPNVEYVSELSLKLTPGREIFNDTPFPYVLGDDAVRVTRRALEFGFDATPTDGDYEVLLIPSYRGHSYLDPFIRLVGSGAMPPDEANANDIPRPVTIFTKAADFTVTGGVIVADSLVNVPDRDVARNFTDYNLSRNSYVLPRELHYRELEIVLELLELLPGVASSTGDSGERVGDPTVLPSSAEGPGYPQEYLPPSNQTDKLQPDQEIALAEAQGDPPVGPYTLSFSQTVGVRCTGHRIRYVPLVGTSGVQGTPGWGMTWLSGTILKWDYREGCISLENGEAAKTDKVCAYIYGPPTSTLATFPIPVAFRAGYKAWAKSGYVAKSPVLLPSWRWCLPETVRVLLPISKVYAMVTPEWGDYTCELYAGDRYSFEHPGYYAWPTGPQDSSDNSSFSWSPRARTSYNYGERSHPGAWAIADNTILHGGTWGYPVWSYWAFFNARLRDARWSEEEDVDEVRTSLVSLDPNAEETIAYISLPITYMSGDPDSGMYSLVYSENDVLEISMYHQALGTWLTPEESKRPWSKKEVMLIIYTDPMNSLVEHVVRIRVRLKGDLVIGDISGMDYFVYLNGKEAYGPL